MTITVAASVVLVWGTVTVIVWAACALAGKCEAALDLLDFDGPLPQRPPR